MKFKISTPEGELNLTSHDLFVQILNKAFEDFETNTNFDTDHIIEELNKILASNKDMLLDSTNKQIYSLYFLAGYYYKIFITKNNVTIE